MPFDPGLDDNESSNDIKKSTKQLKLNAILFKLKLAGIY